MVLRNSIKEITKDMSIYGLSTVIGQVISFFLLPLYTSYLTPSDYGVLSMIGIFTGGYGILSNFGISSAIFRFTGMADSESQKVKYLDTAQFINIFLNVVFSVSALLFSEKLSFWLFNEETYQSYFRFGIFMGFVGSLSSVPLTYLRVRRKTIKIAYSSLLNLGTSIVCTIIGLVVLEMGVWGALVGNTVGNLASLIFLFWNINFPKWSNFSKPKVRKLMNYALPMLPHKAFGFLLPMFSQFILIRYLTLDSLGIYNMAYKFCIPLSVFINLFQKSYSPYRFEILKQDGDSKGMFRKISLLFFLAIAVIYSLTVVFGDDIIKLLTTSKFHVAGEHLLWMALIPIAQGLYFVFGTGMTFHESPKLLPIISGLGFLGTLALSYVLIPNYGINGAAIATTAGWFIMAILVYLYSQRAFSISYAWKEIGWIFIISLIFHVINFKLFEASAILRISLLMLYLFVLALPFRRIAISIWKKEYRT